MRIINKLFLAISIPAVFLASTLTPTSAFAGGSSIQKTGCALPLKLFYMSTASTPHSLNFISNVLPNSSGFFTATAVPIQAGAGQYFVMSDNKIITWNGAQVVANQGDYDLDYKRDAAGNIKGRVKCSAVTAQGLVYVEIRKTQNNPRTPNNSATEAPADPSTN